MSRFELVYRGKVRTATIKDPASLDGWGTSRAILEYICGKLWLETTCRYSFGNTTVTFDQQGDCGKWTGQIGGHPFLLADLSFQEPS